MSAIDWRPDILGAGYDQHVFHLGADSDGEGAVEAVLVRRSPRPREVTRGAVLYAHGFTDYFFQTGLAGFSAVRACGSTRWTCVNAAAPAARARPRPACPTWPATTRN